MNPAHERAFSALQRELDGRLVVERVLRGRKRADGRMSDLFLIATHDGSAHWFHGFYPSTASESASYLRLRTASIELDPGDLDLPSVIALGMKLPPTPQTIAALLIGAPQDGERYVGLIRHPGMPEQAAVTLILASLPQCGADLGLAD